MCILKRNANDKIYFYKLCDQYGLQKKKINQYFHCYCYIRYCLVSKWCIVMPSTSLQDFVTRCISRNHTQQAAVRRSSMVKFMFGCWSRETGCVSASVQKTTLLRWQPASAEWTVWHCRLPAVSASEWTYMPEYPRPNFDHNLRPRRDSRQLITKTNMLNNNDFIIRMLYKDIH